MSSYLSLAKGSMPMFRLSREFTLGDEQLDTEFLAFLIKDKGFRCDSVVGKPAKEAAPKAKSASKRKKRRKARTPLTAERIREFKKAREAGKSYRRIGAIFGVSDGRAWQIINRGK